MRCLTGCRWSLQEPPRTSRRWPDEWPGQGPASTCAPVRPRPAACAEPFGPRSPTPRYRIEAARLRREIIAAGDPLVTVADTMKSLMSGNAGLVVSDGILDEGEPVLAVR